MLTGIESFASLGELVMGVIRFEHLTHQNPEQGFKPGSSSECLLEFDTRSKPLGHHGRLSVLGSFAFSVIWPFFQSSGLLFIRSSGFDLQYQLAANQTK